MHFRASVYLFVVAVLVFIPQAFSAVSDPIVPAWQVGQAVFYRVRMFKNGVLESDQRQRMAVVEQDAATGLYWLEKSVLHDDPRRVYVCKYLLTGFGGVTFPGFLNDMKRYLDIRTMVMQIGAGGPSQYEGVTLDTRGWESLRAVALQLETILEPISFPSGVMGTVRYSYRRSGTVVDGLKSFTVWMSSDVPVTGLARMVTWEYRKSKTKKTIDEYRFETEMEKYSLNGETSGVVGTPVGIKSYEWMYEK